MKQYLALARRDYQSIHWGLKFIYAFLILVWLVDEYAEAFLLQVLFFSALVSFIGRLAKQHSQVFALLAPHKRRYEFNYTVIISTLGCLLLSMGYDNKLAAFSISLLVVSMLFWVLSGRNIQSPNSNSNPLLTLVLGTACISAYIYFRTEVKGLLYSIQDSITYYGVAFTEPNSWALSTACIGVSILIIFRIRTIYLQPREHVASVGVSGWNDVGNITISSSLEVSSKLTKQLNIWFHFVAITERLINFGQKKGQLEQALYPIQNVSNGLNALWLIFFIVLSFLLMLYPHPLEPKSFSAALLFLLPIILIFNILVGSLEFLSNKQLMAFSWLRDKSASRKAYMMSLAGLTLRRQVSAIVFYSLLFCMFAYIAVGNTAIPELRGLLTFSFFFICMLPFQLAYCLKVTAKFDSTISTRITTVLISFIIPSISLAFAFSQPLSAVLGWLLCGVVACVISLLHWRSEHLELSC